MKIRLSLSLAILLVTALVREYAQASDFDEAANGFQSKMATGSASPTPEDLDPTIAKLVALKLDSSNMEQFWGLLRDTADRKGWQRELEQYRTLSGLWHSVRAVEMKSGNAKFVVVFLRTASPFIPSSDYQIAILLDNQGNRLDDLSCEINTRFSHGLHAVVPDKAEEDGAQFVIRLDVVDRRGTAGQTFSHNGVRAKYLFSHEPDTVGRPALWDPKWDSKGLCRVAIKENKFKVLFPSNNDKEPEHRQAQEGRRL